MKKNLLIVGLLALAVTLIALHYGKNNNQLQLVVVPGASQQEASVSAAPVEPKPMKPANSNEFKFQITEITFAAPRPTGIKTTSSNPQ